MMMMIVIETAVYMLACIIGPELNVATATLLTILIALLCFNIDYDDVLGLADELELGQDLERRRRAPVIIVLLSLSSS